MLLGSGEVKLIFWALICTEKGNFYIDYEASNSDNKCCRRMSEIKLRK